MYLQQYSTQSRCAIVIPPTLYLADNGDFRHSVSTPNGAPIDQPIHISSRSSLADEVIPLGKPYNFASEVNPPTASVEETSAPSH